MGDEAGKKRADIVPAVLHAAIPADAQPQSPEVFENAECRLSAENAPASPTPLPHVDRPREVVSTGEVRMHDFDVDHLAVFSRSSGTDSFVSAGSIGSESMRRMLPGVRRVELADTDRPLFGDYRTAKDEAAAITPSFSLLSAAEALPIQKLLTICITPKQCIRLESVEAAADAALIARVVDDVVEQYLKSRPFTTQLNIRLRPISHCLSPHLCIQFRPLASANSRDPPERRRLELRAEAALDCGGDLRPANGQSSDSSTYETVDQVTKSEVWYVPHLMVPPLIEDLRSACTQLSRLVHHGSSRRRRQRNNSEVSEQPKRASLYHRRRRHRSVTLRPKERAAPSIKPTSKQYKTASYASEGGSERESATPSSSQSVTASESTSLAELSFPDASSPEGQRTASLIVASATDMNNNLPDDSRPSTKH